MGFIASVQAGLAELPLGLLSSALVLFAFAWGAALLFTPLSIRVARHIGAVDLPDSRRVHLEPTPRLGGMAIFLSVHLSAAVALSLYPHRDHWLRWWLPLLAGSTIVFAVGLIDDIFNLRARTKLAGQTLSVLVLYSLGIRIPELCGIPLPPGVDLMVTCVFMLAFINAINLIDGVDGLAAGLVRIGALGLFGTFVIRNVTAGAFFTAILIGACSGFLRYNRSPARTFLGDGGSNFLGFMLGALVVESGSKGISLSYFLIPVLAIAVPLSDLAFATWRRGIQSIIGLAGTERPRSILMTADLDHLHHRLLRVGFTHRQVANILQLAAALVVLISMILAPFTADYPWLLGVLLIALGMAILRILPVKEIMHGELLLMLLIDHPRFSRHALGLFLLFDSVAVAGGLFLGLAASHRDLEFETLFFNFTMAYPIWLGGGLTAALLLEFPRSRSGKALSVAVICAGWITLFLLRVIPATGAESFASRSIESGLVSVLIALLCGVGRVGLRAVEALVRRQLGSGRMRDELSQGFSPQIDFVEEQLSSPRIGFYNRTRARRDDAPPAT